MLKHVVVWKIRDPSRKGERGAVVKGALESYQQHPLHLAAKEVVAPLLRDRCVVVVEA
jgi:hypothetical protein